MGNRIGINLWNFANGYTDAQAGLIGKAAALGFGSVEIPVTDPGCSGELIRKEAQRYGVTVTLCACLGKGLDISSFDPAVREATREYFRQAVALGKAAGAEIFAGPVYAGGGKAHSLSPEQRAREWELAVGGVRELAIMALRAGIRVAVEPLNRYRTSVVNTIDQALRLLKDADVPGLGILFDTYQANIEEADLLGAIKRGGEKIIHFHASENNREAPGFGNLDWDQIIKALKKIDYPGNITIETFLPGGFDAAWASPARDPEERAKSGLETLRKELERNGKA